MLLRRQLLQLGGVVECSLLGYFLHMQIFKKKHVIFFFSLQHYADPL